MWWHQARPAALVPRRRASAAVTARANHTGFGTGIRSIYRVHWRPGSRMRARRADDILWRFCLDHMISGGLRARRRWRVVFRGRCLSARQSSVRISRSLSIFQATSLSFEAGSLLTRFGVSRRRCPLAIGVALDRIGRVCYLGRPGSCAHFPRGRRRSRGVRECADEDRLAQKFRSWETCDSRGIFPYMGHAGPARR